MLSRFLKQTLLKVLAHHPLVVAERCGLCLMYGALVMRPSFFGDLLHLTPHIFELFENRPQLSLSYHK